MPNPKRILLAGSTGYVGGAIARRWAALGLGRLGEVQVRGLARRLDTRPAGELRAAGVEVFQADLSHPEMLPEAARGAWLVVHAAKGASPARAAVDLYQAAQQSGAERFIYISTLEVYADDPGAIDEEREPGFSGRRAPDAHLAAERALRENAARPGCPELTILRLGAIYGPEAPRWTKRPLEWARRGRLSVPGMGDFPWLYLFVENMVDAVTAAATAPATGVYNIFDGMTSYAEFMRRYALMTGSRLRHSPAGIARLRASLREALENRLGLPPDGTTEALHASRRPTPLEPYQPAKAARELGWRPRISLDEGMEMIQRSNGFHRPTGRDPNPWKENEEWGEQ